MILEVYLYLLLHFFLLVTLFSFKNELTISNKHYQKYCYRIRRIRSGSS
jgi:hypothetical protein